ncbi:MAG: GAF domain-containing protein, partial [Magnetococcales bacterium]|nr:GAF domain-containing protein [Magnetococcales bacterium]
MKKIHVNIVYKLLLSYSIILLAIIVLGVFGSHQLDRVDTSIDDFVSYVNDTINHKIVPILKNVDQATQQIDTMGDAAHRAAADVKHVLKLSHSLQEQLGNNGASLKLSQSLDQSITELSAKIDQIRAAADSSKVSVNGKGGDLAFVIDEMSKMTPSIASVDEILDRMVEYLEYSFIIIIVSGFYLSILVARQITIPIVTLRNNAMAIAQGQFGATVEINTNDEIGDLAASFKEMVDNLYQEMARNAQERQTTQNILSSMTDTLLVVSPEMQVQQANCIEILEYVESELVGLPVERLFSTADNEAGEAIRFTAADFSRMVRTGSTVHFEAMMVAKTGRLIPVLVSGSVLRGEDNSVRGTILVAKDITDFKQAQQQLQEQSWMVASTAKFSNIVQQARTLGDFAQSLIQEITPFLDGVYGVMYILEEGQGRYQPLGRYGFQGGEAPVGFTVGESIVGQSALERKLIHLVEVPVQALQIRFGAGEATPLEIVAVPVTFQDNSLAVIELASFKKFTKRQLSFLQEVTVIIGLGLDNLMRVHRMEELLKQLQEQTLLLQSQQSALASTNAELDAQKREVEQKATELVQSSQYKSEFLANMSHEIRTPMNAVIGLSDLALQLDMAPKLRDYLTKISSSSRSLLRIINDIL